MQRNVASPPTLKGNMAKVLVVKVLGKLQPVDDAGESVLRRFAQGEIFAIEVTKPRNVQFHRKLMAMLQIILANQTHYKSVEDLLAVCKLRIGHTHKIQTAKGIYEVPASISFAEMDDIEFADFYDRACEWVLQEVLPGLRRLDLNSEVEEQLRRFGDG